MTQADYQLALLLQREFEAETKRNSNTSDYNMALMLQNHFQLEMNIDNPRNNLVYDRKNSQNLPKNDYQSLVDPSWELIDPTPNIHTLFVAFNERFFWNKLQTVCVLWSKRMTSCAGVCTYNPGGMCAITLSEPLLKLRPRKDLVETLLHEMIHAYLFVTHNNRDRDGHGPEFHKHMYRINKDAGTNITIYHSFHDEVRLYQQHWWRCNGPCQHRKPFFGIVRRATNRAPGPNDRWWNEHLQTCGGIFNKIREPERTTKLQTKKNNTAPTKNPNNDIRNFVQILNGKSKQIENDKNVNNKSKIKNFHNLNDNSKITNISSNIVGFVNSNKSLNKMRSNSNSTIVITKKLTTSTNTNNSVSNSSNKNFQSTGQTLQLNAVVKSNDCSVVRSHWLNKFDLNTETGNKRTQNEVPLEGGVTSLKKYKLTNPTDDPVVLKESVECPVCEKKIPVPDLNDHIDKCLEFQTETVCVICGQKIQRSQLNNHQTKCFNNNFADDCGIQKCEICNAFIEQNHQEEHTKACLAKIFDPEVENTAPQALLIECQVCNEMIDSGFIEKHTDLCLHKMFNEIEDRVGLESSNVLVSCVACSNEVRRSELNTHLEECMKDVFDNKNKFIDIKEDNEDKKSKFGCESEKMKSYNCPFCLELYSEFDMCAHIDKCLASDESKSNDKTSLIDSFINDDF